MGAFREIRVYMLGVGIVACVVRIASLLWWWSTRG
jgi:hypothetical protein